ncbi:inositol monophosphatase [Pseudomonas aeruginosa]|nr:inositol monophosphatase [Pseudomonas aeruginosa]HCE6123139.1 inositol monophosphatase [Pseudomonas aeruginosa]
MSQPEFQKILPLVIQAVERAGHLLELDLNRPGGPRGSGDKAEVDAEIEELLRPLLLQILSCDWWGEETGYALTGHASCWVVDPNDGTSDFLKGKKGSAVSVGLLHENQPVLGVVYAPVTSAGIPDCVAWAMGMSHLLRNGVPIKVDLNDQDLTQGSLVMVSAAAAEKPDLNRELCAPGDFMAMTSIAYRLAKVAAGDGVCGISLSPVSAHDVVAGHALLLGANGVLLNETGEAIEYKTELEMLSVSKRCFGGARRAALELASREWSRVLV